MSRSTKFTDILSIIKRAFKVNHTNYTLGRWSSSLDKQRWELYADFANNDNCCCSYPSNIKNKSNNIVTIKNKFTVTTIKPSSI